MTTNDKKRKLLKLLRKHHELSQEKMAKLLDISVVHLSNIETGKSRCTLDLIVIQAQVFNIGIVDISRLFNSMTDQDDYNKMIIADMCWTEKKEKDSE